MNVNEEIDETEFYHEDFTTASEWEVFTARIEEIINQWRAEDSKGHSEATVADFWNLRTENLSFVDFEFKLSLLRNKNNVFTEAAEENPDSQEKKNPFNTPFDFELHDPNKVVEHSCLWKWYGINEYIVLSPAGKVGVISESRIKVLLSSLYLVCSNLKCEIPLFVQIREKWQQLYLGVYQCAEIRTNLEMVHLHHTLSHLRFLSGLLELFKSKIVSPTMMSTIIVSLQSSYILNDFGNFYWHQEYLNHDSDSFERNLVCALPFGVTVDPINSIVLKTTWNHLNHRSMKDSESYTDFSPMRARKWSMLITTTEQPICLLGEALTEFLHLLNNSATVYDVLGDFITTSAPDSSNPLDLLTETRVPTISSLISKAARNSLTRTTRRGPAPLPEDVLVSMLYFLFPDAEDSSPHVYKENTLYEQTNAEALNLEHECRGFKTCMVDSLVWRLSIVLSHAIQSLGGVRSFAHFWYEFVQEMRYRWDKNISIPGISSGYPDLRCCLLHQKLQMLNCCIERKQSRENSVAQFDSAESSSSDEEFFDCADKPEEEQKKKVKHSLWNQPVGRLGKFNNLKLLSSGDPLYIPVTQEPVPKSEDQLEEDTNVLLQLGSDAQGSELRAKMMSASLLSDMESFKAANPGSILEDFIRWYSPRDWIEEEEEQDEWGQKKGQLSSRMLIEDNFWVQTWKNAKPVPAHRQKRLFDDTREAEKVLHFLESRSLAQVCEMLTPVLSHAAIYKLSEECQQASIELPDSADRLRSLIKGGERISRESKLQQRRFETFIQEVTTLELKVSQVNSLMYKFNPAGTSDDGLSKLIADLVTGLEVAIENKAESPVGGRLLAMFAEAERAANMITTEKGDTAETGQAEGGNSPRRNTVLPQPNEREIVMRVSVPRPATYSAECPQFMRAVLSKSQFRLAGAFSEDIVFF